MFVISVGGDLWHEALPPPDTLVRVAANAFTMLNFDFIRDAAPVAGVVRVPNVRGASDLAGLC